MTSKPNASDLDLSAEYDVPGSIPSPIAKQYSAWLGAASRVESVAARRPTRRGQRPALRHFLLLHDPAVGRLDILEFDDAAAAISAYGTLELEHLDHLGPPGLEIVLLGADSLDTIRRTHRHYFSRGEVGLPNLAAGTT